MLKEKSNKKEKPNNKNYYYIMYEIKNVSRYFFAVSDKSKKEIESILKEKHDLLSLSINSLSEEDFKNKSSSLPIL